MIDNYDDNNWISYDGRRREWAVAYYGTGGLENSKVKKRTNLIIEGEFKAWKRAKA